MRKLWSGGGLRLLAAALCCLVLAGCSGGQTALQGGMMPAASAAAAVDPQEKTTGVNFFFDTVVTITLYGAPEGLMDEIWAECARYEGLLSRTIETSDVSRINKANGQTVTVDPDTWEILRRAREINRLTGGAFSVTIAPISTLWTFTGLVNNAVPTDEKRAELLPLVDDQKISLGEGSTVTLPAGMQVDLGGIAKGYIADRVAEMIRGRVTAGIISLGGNVYTVGCKPNGTKFAVGITDPWDSSRSLAAVYTGDATVVTSGTYERGFNFGGQRYHHILDPKTGWPAQSDLISATFVMDSSMTADALATACIVLGSEQGLALAQAQGLDAVFIKKDGTMLFTEGFEEKYEYRPL